MAAEVAEVENEKENLLQYLLQEEEEITKLKKNALSLQNHIDSHSCSFILPSGNEDPTTQISQLNTELKMEKRDHKKTQTGLETTMKIMQAKDG